MHFQLVVVLASGLAGAALAQTNTSTAWPPYSPTAAPMFQLSADDEMAFYLEEVLSLANNGGSNTGEVLRIATQLVPSDFESVYQGFYPMAQAINAIAHGVDVSKDPVGAREAYFRAATYYRGADFFLIGNASDPRNYALWDQQLKAFNNAIALLPVPGERFSVPTYSPNVGNYTAIGTFYKASTCNTRTPTLLVGNGYDGSQEESYHSVCVEVLKRGINCATYEGPGQPTVRRQQNIGFIPDWWTAASPIVDYLETRQDVDMTRLGLVGISFGGTLAPLAASHDNRYSAVIAIDGLHSLRDALAEQFGPEIVGPFTAGNKSEFDLIVNSIRTNSSYDSSLRWILDQSLWAFDTTSPYDWFYRLGNVNMSAAAVSNITAPVFVAKGQDDTSTLNQPEIAYAMLVNNRTNGAALTTYHQFNTSLGAGEHCSIGAEAQLWQVVMDWLSGVWGGFAYTNGFVV